jgi:hypothetical protein
VNLALRPRSATPNDAVAFLACPDVYPHRPSQVDTVETHFSWLFLAGDKVFKLKKPVAGDGFDFTTVDARRRNAESEVEANQRFAPGIYLGVSRSSVGSASWRGAALLAPRSTGWSRCAACRLTGRSSTQSSTGGSATRCCMR